MYQASALLQRHLCDTWGIPKDRNHIVGHDEWKNATWTSWMAANLPSVDTTCNTHTDPGQFWDWSHFMALIGGTTSPEKSQITSPANGSTFSSSSVAFTWSTGSGVSQYWLYVGNSAGANDIYAADQGTSLSRTVSGIPTDGRTIYVRLWSSLSSGWQYADYTYKAFTGTTIAKAVMTSPANGSTFSSSSVPFTWNTGSGASDYFLYLGSSAGGNDIYSADQGMALSRTVTGVPTNGRTIYVRLWSNLSSGWQYNDYTYTAFTGTSAAKAQMTSPANGSTFGSSSVAFVWNAGSGVSDYYLYVGNSAGASDIYGADQGTALSRTVAGIPTDGRTIYVRLWSNLSSGWQYNDYTYRGCSESFCKPLMDSQ
jgi:serine protease